MPTETDPENPPLDLDGLELWLVERGMRGLPLEEQITAFCQRIYEAGFPMKRCQMGMDTLHPRYGSHTFVWQPGSGAIEHVPRERTLMNHDVYLRSPVHFMRSRGIAAMRRRLDQGDPDDFLVFAELRRQGLTEYAARIVPYDPAQLEAIAKEANAPSKSPGPDTLLEGIFFSCATDRPAGFDPGQLDQVFKTLPYLALALKTRLTYDVANTVLETYLGQDAGSRVLTGKIERGSVDTIDAVVWFSDLRGFTQLADSLAGNELVETLDDYLEFMARPIQDNHGQVLKFMGDGLLATFELTGRDEATVCKDALSAAATLRSSFPAFNAARKAAGKPVMDFGLSLHLGEVLYGNIGASDRLDFTVVGSVVNEASRIQELCKEFECNILVSKPFRDAAGSSLSGLESLGFHALRGVRAPQELFSLRG
jgi:adenylate cyclase